MSVIQAIILGIVQGITEFLPISSSGHLTLLQHFFEIHEPPLFFNIAVHVGTLIATIVYFRKIIWGYITGILNSDKATWRKIGIIVIATIPTAFAGIIFEKYLDGLFNSLLVVGFGFLCTSLFLRQLHHLSINNSKTNDQPSIKDALIIGLFQSFAILPGVTRSGSTILAGKMQNLSLESAFDFSFIISIPAILGALLLQLLSFEGKDTITPEIIGGLTAAIVGYIALHILKQVITKRKLMPFAWYALGLSAITFFSVLF